MSLARSIERAQGRPVGASKLSPSTSTQFPLAAPLEGVAVLGERERGGTPNAGPNSERSAAELGLGTNHITVTTEYQEEFGREWQRATEEKRKRYETLGFAKSRVRNSLRMDIRNELILRDCKAALLQGILESARVISDVSSHWHASRAKTMSIPPIDRKCEIQRFVSCGCKSFPVGGCGAKTCKTCNGRRWGQVRRKVLRAVEAQGGAKWRMLTLAGPPRDTPKESMDALQKAWARMRAWMYKRWRKSFEFVMVFEVGARNGLIHAHILAKFPGFIDYGDVGEEWVRAYPGAVTGGAHFSKRDVYKNGEKTGRKTTIFTPKTGAYYIAKYATKGLEVLKLPAKLAARTLSAMDGRRIVRASQGFWTTPDPVCSDCGWRFGIASGRNLVFAIELHSRHQESKARPVARNGDTPKSRSPGDSGGGRTKPSVDWAECLAGHRVLVETKRTFLERLAPSADQAPKKRTETHEGSTDASAYSTAKQVCLGLSI